MAISSTLVCIIVSTSFFCMGGVEEKFKHEGKDLDDDG